MAENESTTKVEEENLEGAPDEGADLLSLESLDEIIANEDPEFAQGLTEIGPDNPAEIYNEGSELEYTLAEEIKLWEYSSSFRKKLATTFPILPKASFKFKMKRMELRLTWSKWKEQAVQNIVNAGPMLLAWWKRKMAAGKESLTQGVQAFKTFSIIKKIAFVGLVIATGAGVYIVYKTATTGLIPHEKELFMGSLSDWAQNKYQYDPKAGVESFYESTRTSQNILLMQRMVVNLKRSAESGPNPMGAFEFFVEGAASEVVIEIKDREPEVEDLFLRTIEEMTFDEVASGEGKQLLCERLRKEVNKILTRGYVRRIFIKTAIIKP